MVEEQDDVGVEKEGIFQPFVSPVLFCTRNIFEWVISLDDRMNILVLSLFLFVCFTPLHSLNSNLRREYIDKNIRYTRRYRNYLFEIFVK